MLADLSPLMTETVQHWMPPLRDIHGRETSRGHTNHLARVTYSPGDRIGVASRENSADAAATVWLVDHPRTIAIGDVFKLSTGDTLKAIRIERRTIGGGVLSKVYLS